MSNKNKFKIGDIVAIKSHPLFSASVKKINEFAAQVPPLMLVKEVLFEKEETKTIYSDKIENAQIADIVKYNCVFFNGNKSEFVEKTLYESILDTYKNLKYYREFENDKKIKIDLDKQLIPEVLKYIGVSNYEYGKVVQFKTKKLEHRKSFSTSGERIPGISYQTPDFVLSGIKNEEQRDLFYQNGKPKRVITKRLYKVLWFNHVQQKYSENYLPEEFFVECLEL